MKLTDLQPPAPAPEPPAWKQQLAEFWRRAPDQQCIDMQVTLKMGDRAGAQRILENWQQSLQEKRRRRSHKKSQPKRRFQYGAYGGWFYPGFHNDSGADSSADAGGGDGGGGESLRESELDLEDLVPQFVQFCCDQLEIKQAPLVKLRRDPVWSERNSTFGRFNPDGGYIELSVANRHPVDVLRTLAHELTHHRQDEISTMPDDAGRTGSPWEDEANAVAGRIMRDFAAANPEYFGSELEEGWREQAGALATAACIAGTPGCATTDALKTVQTVGRTAQTVKDMGRAGAEEELRQRVRDALRRQRGEVTPESVTETEHEFKEDRTANVVLDTGEKRRVRYLPTTKDIVDTIIRYYLKQGLKVIKVDDQEVVWKTSPESVTEASGYIPTAAEKNDPRFSMALTVDVHPGQTGKEANKLGLKTDSQGRPALLMKKLNNLLEAVKLDEDCWDGYRKQGMKKKGDRMVPNCVRVSETDVPQPGESSGAAKQFKPDADIKTKNMTVTQIMAGVKGIPYVNNVIDDWDAKNYSWNVTKKSIEYATYLKNNPQSLANLPPIIVIDGKLDDGAHRLSAINLLQKRMDPNNPLWKQARLQVKFAKGSDVIAKPTVPAKITAQAPDVRGIGGAYGGPGPKLPMPGQIMPRNENAQVTEDEDLMEVKMSPAEFQKFLRSPAAEGIRAGFEAELIFRNTQSDAEGGGEAEPDYEADERAYSIQDIIDFFQGGDNPIGRRAADRLSQELTEQFSDWAREQFANDYFDLDRFMSWAEENVWPDNEDEYREQARDALDDEEISDEELEKQAVQLFRDDVERDWDRSGAWYEQASEELFDEYWGDLDQSDWLDQQGLRYMSNVAEEYNLDWPYWTDGSGSGGERDWDDISNSLATVTGMPVRVSGGYHGAARREGQYIVEPDSSLDSDDSDDYGLEIVSPPMPLPEAIEQLGRIIDWANGPGDAYTNSSTGLHMGVSLPYKGGDVDPIKLILFMGDKNLLETFGRESNTYARSAYERLESKIRGMRNAGPKQIAGVMELMKKNLIELADREMKRGVLGDKYVSVNPHDGYIEFRGPGGDYLSKEDEIDGVLENTMLRLAYAMSIAGSPDLYRKEYAKKLYKVLTKDDPANPFMRLFADYSAGDLTGEELKRQWADTVLQAERGNVEIVPPYTSPTGEYEVYDRDSGTSGDRDSYTVIDTFRADNDGEAMAKAIENWSGKGVNFGVRAKVAEPEEQKPKSRRAELAKRVTRSTRDVGEQLWRVNHHSSVRWITARSQAEAVKQAIQQDRAFNSAETRARIATDLEKTQWNLDQERQRERDAGRDAAEIRARLGVPVPAGGGERTYRVTWTDRSTMGEVQDSLNVRARSAQQAMQNIRDELERRGREVVRIEADEVTAPARDGEPIPGSTLDLQRRRAQQTQGEWTGHWIVRDSQGRELTRFHGIGNAQSDANRHAAAWLGRNRPDLVGQDVDVVPEMQ
jgi:hypothetical protein